MNKITVNEIISKEIDDTILVDIEESIDFLGVSKIVITPKKSTNLEIIYNVNEFKANVIVNLNENINFNLFELREGKNLKVKYEYNLDRSSSLKVSKFYDCESVKELDTINLNGEYASVEYILKTIATSKQNYTLRLNHFAKSTISKVVNSGVNITGSIDFKVEGVVLNGNSDCELNQNNRIITFNDNVCKIDPIFLIDENDVVADHSALIGKFSEDELFYLESRGIDYNNAINLLVKGFLLDEIQDSRLDKIINKYWR